MNNGKLIVIEGACDGIGKSTQSDLLKNHLISDGEEVITHHFPSYETKQGALVEDYLRGVYGPAKDSNNYFIHSLYAIDRAVTWQKDLKKEYENGKIILLDRYTTSSLIYQSALIEDINKKKEFIDFVTDYEYGKLGIKKPDSVIFLYADFDLATKIRMARNSSTSSLDIHEADLEFMKKVYDNAMFIADYLSWDKVKCDNSDNMRSIPEIHKDVYNLVRKIK